MAVGLSRAARGARRVCPRLRHQADVARAAAAARARRAVPQRSAHHRAARAPAHRAGVRFLGQEDGSYFLALELVEGVHLGQLVQHVARAGVTLPIPVRRVHRRARRRWTPLRARAQGSPERLAARDRTSRRQPAEPVGLTRRRRQSVGLRIAQQSDVDGRAKRSMALGKVVQHVPRAGDGLGVGSSKRRVFARRRLARALGRAAARAGRGSRRRIGAGHRRRGRLCRRGSRPMSTQRSTRSSPRCCRRAAASASSATAALVAERLDAWLATRNARIGRAALGRWMKQHAPDHGATWQIASSLRSESSAPTAALVDAAPVDPAAAPLAKPETDERTTKPRPATRTTGPQARTTSAANAAAASAEPAAAQDAADRAAWRSRLPREGAVGVGAAVDVGRSGGHGQDAAALCGSASCNTPRGASSAACCSLILQKSRTLTGSLERWRAPRRFR